MCSSDVTEKPKTREKRLSLDYLPWFHANFFIRFWEEGQYEPKTTGALTFLVGARGGARGVPGGPLPPQWPPKNFPGLFLKVLHRPLTAPLVANLAPLVAPPNENVWLRPWSAQRTFDWDGWNGFVWRGRCRDWDTTGPQISMPVIRGAGYFSPSLEKFFWFMVWSYWT